MDSKTPRTDFNASSWSREYEKSRECGWPSINDVVDAYFARELERENVMLRKALASCYALAQNKATNDIVRRHAIKEVVDDALVVNAGAVQQDLEDDVSTSSANTKV